MIKINKLLFIIPLIIVGCKTTQTNEKLISQSIDNLNLNIFSNEGEKLFAIQSPNSIYSKDCLLYTSPSPRDRQKSRMPSSA